MRHRIIPIGLLGAGLLLTTLSGINACGSGEDNEETSTAQPVPWTTVASILKETCAGSGTGCHNQTTQNGDLNFLTITEEEFLDSAALSRIQDEQSPMPPAAGSEQNPDGIALSEDDRLTLIKYLSQ